MVKFLSREQSMLEFSPPLNLVFVPYWICKKIYRWRQSMRQVRHATSTAISLHLVFAIFTRGLLRFLPLLRYGCPLVYKSGPEIRAVWLDLSPL